MERVEIGGIAVEVTRKRIRNMNLKVLPPDGRVALSAPLSVSDSSIRDFVESRREWILKNRSKIVSKPEHRKLRFISGSELLIFGTPYTLEMVASPSRRGIEISGGTARLYAPAGAGEAQLQALVDDWYRSNLMSNLLRLVRRWEPVMGVKVKEVKIRRMKTRWGTCNPRASRIWFSLMLAPRRPELIEYIVVHEMVHLLEASHNKRFYALMDHYLPGWKRYRRELR